MPRLLFEKKGNAVWISHLDLMRLFQRAFKRAGLPLTHTQGFNPRPSVSIALPLSVGIESSCELLDFDLDGELPPDSEICTRLNAALIEGVRVLEVYRETRKIRDLALLRCILTMEYDDGVSQQKVDAIEALFSRQNLLVEKKSKNGVAEQDILPMIREIKILKSGDREMTIQTLICCQNPSLNPMQIHAAIVRYLPEAVPDHTICRRVEIYDDKNNIFR